MSAAEEVEYPCPNETPMKTSIIQKRILQDPKDFAHDTSAHFLELCEAVRRGDLEVVQTFPFLCLLT